MSHRICAALAGAGEVPLGLELHLAPERSVDGRDVVTGDLRSLLDELDSHQLEIVILWVEMLTSHENISF